MTPPEQAKAARLTAIAEKMEARCWHNLRVYGHALDSVGTEIRVLPLTTAIEVASEITADLSAHVETLTQQVAELTQTVTSMTGEEGTVQEIIHVAVKFADDPDAAVLLRHVVAQAERLKHAKQENARLTGVAEAKTAIISRIAAETIERLTQQRDAAHAALRQYEQLVNELKAARLDPGHESLIGIDRDRAAARVLAADVALLKGISHWLKLYEETERGR